MLCIKLSILSPASNNFCKINFETKLPYTYKFSKNVTFEVFTVNWTSMKFHPPNFIGNFALHQLESRIVVNIYAATFDNCKV